MADDMQALKEALLRRATGYDYDEKEFIVDKTGKTQGRARVIKKHVPPSMEAIRMIARMKRSGEW